ncbi:MAG TPA: DUF3078 domain-containing protein, partial [Bacteroidia bacterium]|nr:DUF3078 domain-containing protein [Bacteroidia bacterium]
MKRFLLISFFLIPGFVFSQHLPDSLRHWHRGGMAGLNFTQASFTNWAAGGENSISGQALLGLYLNYKKDSTSWDNSLDLAYGILKQNGNLLRKTDD